MGLGESRSSGCVADVLLMRPALGVFPCNMQPGGRWVWSCPAHRNTDRIEVDARQIGPYSLTRERQQLAQKRRADSAGGVDPAGIALVDVGDQCVPPGEVGWGCWCGGRPLEAVAATRQQTDIAAEKMECDIVGIPPSQTVG